MLQWRWTLLVLALPAVALLGLLSMHVQLLRQPADAAQKQVLPPSSIKRPSQHCVVMFDNRPAQTPSSAADLQSLSYLSFSIAANALYAKHHGYRFLFYNFSRQGCQHPLQGDKAPRELPMTWCKLVVLEDALLRGHKGPPCELALLLDSDAVVSGFHTRLEDFVAQHGQGRTVLLAHLDNKTMALDNKTLWNVHGVLKHHPWMVFSHPGRGNYLNAGVMIFQRGDGRRVRAMLEEWWRSAPKKPPPISEHLPAPCWGNCLRNWPHEQAVFELFVWPQFRDDVTLLPLSLMNGFSGEYVRHLWGLVKDRRTEVMRDVLAANAIAAGLPEVAAGEARPEPAAADDDLLLLPQLE